MMNEKTDLERINYSIDDFCRAYGISRGTLYGYWRSGDGPEYITVGHRRLIPAQAAKTWRPKQARGAAA